MRPWYVLKVYLYIHVKRVQHFKKTNIQEKIKNTRITSNTDFQQINNHQLPYLIRLSFDYP